MLVYVGKRYTATVTGLVIKEVQCERCRKQYFYELARTGVGSASAPYYLGQTSASTRADKAARKQLAKKLRTEVEAVPCPGCGWIQQDMVRELRQRRYRWMMQLALFAGPVALLICFVAGLIVYLDNRSSSRDLLHVGESALLIIAIASAVLALRWQLIRQIDPNESYPRRPAVAPGTPPALLKEMTHGAERYVPAQQERVTAPNDWAEVQLQRCVLPPICCTCLGSADRTFKTPLVTSNNLPIALCKSCFRKMVWRWWGWTGVSLLLGLAVAATVALSIRRADSAQRWIAFMLIGLFGSIFAIAIIPLLAVRPYRMKMIDTSRGIVRLKFRNAEYTKLLIEGYLANTTLRVTPDLTTVVPPPPAKR